MGCESPALLAGFAGQVRKGSARGSGVSGEPPWSTNLLCAHTGDLRSTSAAVTTDVLCVWEHGICCCCSFSPCRLAHCMLVLLPGLTGTGLRVRVLCLLACWARIKPGTCLAENPVAFVAAERTFQN